MSRRRYVFVCDAGNVRSYSLCVAMKRKGHEAINVGRKNLSRASFLALGAWATHVVITKPEMIESIPDELRAKLSCANIGEDRWGMAFHIVHPDLYPLAERHVEQLLLK